MSDIRVQQARSALQADPTQAQLWVDYIESLWQAGKADEARKMLALGRGKGLKGQAIEALESKLIAMTGNARPAALQIARDLAEQLNHQGTQFKAEGRLADAEACYRDALAIQPNFATAHYNLANTLKQQGRAEMAIHSYVRALALEPDFAGAHYNLGNLYRDLERLPEAESHLREAVRHSPRLTIAHFNLGNVLHEVQRSIEAEDAFRRAIALQSDLHQAHSNLGIALAEQSRNGEAVEQCRLAVAMKPDADSLYSSLLFVLNYQPDKPAKEIYTAYQAYEQQFGLPLRTQWAPHANAPLASGGASSAPRRLRIGYVSPDLRQHSVRHFLEPLLACHDRLRFEVFAYAELAREDAATQRYKSYADHWIPTMGMSDEALASRIRADAIDVLVDVAGHTAGNRLLVFARKPAPVSLSWLGYGYTTGLAAIDYLLTDEASAPAGSEHLFSEAPWRLPGTAYVYRPDPAMGQLSALPALANGFLTFGTLTRAIRINHRTVRVWAEILQRVPGSRLVIDSKNFQHASMQEAMAERFAQHGIARERLLIGCHSPPWDTLRSIDIGLDCFPHNSGTTLFETLFMGVPYVTLAGRPSVGRLGKSILSGLGKPEWLNAWCATSEQEYIDKAIALASDLTALARIRTELRPQMQRSALMDEAGFARRVEHAYAQMFERWQAQQGPQARHAPPQEARA